MGHLYRNGTKRGEIYNRKLASQLNDFSGLLYGKITPTDIDGFVEFGDKLYIVLELKRTGNTMPAGQELALTRLVARLYKSGVPSYLLVASHNSKGDVFVANCIVDSYYNGCAWTTPQSKTTIREAIDILYSVHVK